MPWARAVGKPGDSVRTGDRLRTAPDGVARFDLPWMSVTAGPATVMHIPAEVVLSIVLGEGRAELEACGRDIVKVRTAEAEIRGSGRIVVRRERERTLVMAMAMEGTFRVEASGETVVLLAGQGTVVRDGEAPRPAQTLPEAPGRLRPGADALYVPSGQPATLNWSPAAASSHVQVMALGSDEVLIAQRHGDPRAHPGWTRAVDQHHRRASACGGRAGYGNGADRPRREESAVHPSHSLGRYLPLARLFARCPGTGKPALGRRPDLRGREVAATEAPGSRSPAAGRAAARWTRAAGPALRGRSG